VPKKLSAKEESANISDKRAIPTKRKGYDKEERGARTQWRAHIQLACLPSGKKGGVRTIKAYCAKRKVN